MANYCDYEVRVKGSKKRGFWHMCGIPIASL